MSKSMNRLVTLKSLYIAIPEDLGGSYSQTGNVIVLQEKSQSVVRKLNLQVRPLIRLWPIRDYFLACQKQGINIIC